MRKNQMTEVAALLGVAIDEEFEIDEYGTYVLTLQGLIAKNGSAIQGVILTQLLTGELTLKHKPWKPNDAEFYYYVDEAGCICTDTFDGIAEEIILYKVGNCYRTHEDAEANIDKWISFYASDKVLDV